MRERNVMPGLGFMLGTAASALAMAMSSLESMPRPRPTPIRKARPGRYYGRGRCRSTKGFLGEPRFKGSNLAKAGARRAAKRSKASRRAAWTKRRLKIIDRQPTIIRQRFGRA